MRNFSIKKDNIFISATLLSLFTFSIYYNQDKLIVSVFAYLFLISILPIMIYLISIIRNNSIINQTKLHNDYKIINQKVKFNWILPKSKKISNNQFYKELQNTFFLNQHNNNCYQFLNQIFNNQNNISMKIIFIDCNGINTFVNRNTHLLCPVLTKNHDLLSLLNQVIEEMNHRYDLLLKKDVKNYYDYNVIARDIKEVLIIINDAEETIKNKELCNNLIRILMHGKDVGIKIMMFTNLTSTDLNLSCFNDLLLITDRCNIKLK